MVQRGTEPVTDEAIEVSDELFAHLPNGLDLCYQTFGDPKNPTILLIMGLGGPMTWWTNEFCLMLADRGFHVVRYDNRDTGRSTKLRHHRVSRKNVVAAFIGRGTAPYGLEDMADDVIGLLDHLNIDAAHLVGVSMGGMISQVLAVEYPDRVLSLTSIMSSTGRRKVGWIHPRIVPTMLASVGRTRTEFAENSVKNGKAIASPAFPTDDHLAYVQALETYDRGWIGSGVLRHMLAVLTQADRTERLQAVTVPTWVIHGTNDQLVNKSGGRATADAITDARYQEIAGLGHDLPAQLYETFVESITANIARTN